MAVLRVRRPDADQRQATVCCLVGYSGMAAPDVDPPDDTTGEQRAEVARLREKLGVLQRIQADLRASLESARHRAETEKAELSGRLFTELEGRRAAQRVQIEGQNGERAGVAEDLNSARAEVTRKLSDAKAHLSSLRPKLQTAAVAARLTDLAHEARDGQLAASGHKVTRYPFEGRPLEGVLAGLGEKAHDRGVVTVTASGCLDESRLHPKNAADVAVASNFVSANGPNQWIAYDFGRKVLRLTHYAVKSRTDGREGSNNPKDWVVEVSDDGSQWTLVDQRQGNSDLNGTASVAAFPVQNEVDGCRFVRFRLTGPAHSGKNFLVLSAFEVFGSLRE